MSWSRLLAVLVLSIGPAVAAHAQPDLVVTIDAAPVSADEATSIEVTWTVENQGDGDATGGWSDKVLLSADDQPGTDVFLAAFTINGPLAIGATYMRTETITLPQGETGDRWIIVETDSANTVTEEDEGNNFGVSAGATSITPLYANLVVTDIVAPSSGGTYQNVDVTWRVQNLGTLPSVARYDRVLLSSDDQPGGDTYAYEISRNVVLQPGEEDVVNASFPLPANVPGTFQFVVHTDWYGYIDEGPLGEDNAVIDDTTIDIAGPDLIVSDITIDATPPLPSGGEVTTFVSWTVTNQGVGTAFYNGSATYDEVYLSTDTIAGNGDDVYIGQAYVESFLDNSIAPGGSYTTSLSGTITLPAILGDFYVVIRTDDADRIVEVPPADDPWFIDDETIELAELAPDFVVTDIVAPSTGATYQSVDVSWTVRNDGDFANADARYDRVLLSSDDQPGGDTYAYEISRNVVLQPGEEDVVNASFPLPANVPGTFQFVVHTDWYGNIPESDENNAVIDDTTIDIAGPDLIVSDITIDATPPLPSGGEVTTFVSWTVTNQGVGTAFYNGSATYDEVYLSTDTIAGNGDDVYIGQAYVESFLDNSIAPGGSYTTSLSGTITLPAILGDFYVVIRTDDADRIVEVPPADDPWFIDDETIELAELAPDFVVTDIVAPSTGATYQSVDVSWTVRNDGDFANADARYDRVLLSSDDQPGGDTYAYEISRNVVLQPGEEDVVNASFPLPANVPGTFQFVVHTDWYGYIPESDENNAVIDDTTIDIAGPDLVVSDITIDATPPLPSGGEVTTFVSWTVTNQGVGTAFYNGSATYDEVYLSTDTIAGNGDDVYIGQAYVESFLDNSIAPGGSYTTSLSGTITLPAILGDFYVVIRTDDADRIVEVPPADDPWFIDDETIELAELAPDFVVTDIVAPSTGATYQSVDVSWTVRNDGDFANADARYDRVLLSSDDQPGGDTYAYEISRNVVLQPGEEDVVNASFPLPANVPGTFQFVVHTDWYGNIPESDENNAVIDDTMIDIAGPDLVVSEIIAPAIVPGSAAVFSWTVTNEGVGTAFYNGSATYDQVFLSLNTTPGDADDVYLGQTYVESFLDNSIPPGGSYTTSLSTTIPVDATGGEFTVIRLDTHDRIVEVPPADDPYFINVPPVGPDLLVSDVSVVPTQVQIGEPIQIFWTVTNIGNEDASGWVDEFLLSTDEQIGADLSIGSFAFQGTLTSGQSVPRSASAIVPPEAAGVSFFIALVDSANQVDELDETNNVATTVDQLEAVGPNLVASNLTATPNPATLGQPIAIDFQVDNVGTGTALTTWSDVVYLSLDDTLDGTDVPLASAAPDTVPFDPTQSYVTSLNPTLPIDASITAGDWYLIAAPDALGQIVEIDETDNASNAFPIAINVPPLPDFQITVFAHPSTADPLGAIDVSWTVENTGAVDATGPWNDRLSIATLADGSDAVALVPDEMFNGTLAASASYTVTLNGVALPAEIGTRWLVLEIDVDDAIEEHVGETDNRLVSAQPLELLPPDLVASVTNAPATIDLTVPFTVDFDVTNNGTGGALAAWTDRLYLSSDAILSGDDIVLQSVGATGTLATTETYASSFAHTIGESDGIALGPWNLLVVTDATGVQVEGDDANNVATAVPVTVAAPPSPNLLATAPSAPSDAEAESSITIDWTTTNSGNADADGPWTDQVWLSTDTQFGVGDILLGSTAFAGSIAQGGSAPSSFTGDLPGLTPGTYYVFVKIDATNALTEVGGEADNTSPASTPVNVTPAPRADLSITNIDAPTNATAGQIISLTWTTTNSGQTTAEGLWRDRVYLQPDDEAVGDIFVGEFVRVGPIAEGGAEDSTEQIVLPLDRSGAFRVRIETDATNTINEGQDESNNTLVDDTTLDIVAAPLPNFTVTSVSALPDPVTVGQTITIAWTGMNTGATDSFGSYTDRVYLSTDQQFGGGDLLVASEVSFAPVLAAGTWTPSIEIAAPNHLGTYYLVVVADATDVIEEGEFEDDNVGASITTITINAAPKPDLSVVLGAVPTDAQAGAAIDVSWTVTSEGPADAEGDWTDAIYLSADMLLDGGDSLLRVQPAGVSSLSTGTDYTRGASVTLPVQYVESDWYLIAVTDSSNALDEENETNNAAVGGPVTVEPTPVPDFVIESATPGAANAEFNASLQIDWTVRNDGERPAIGTWSDVVFISNDASESPDDLPLYLEALVDQTVDEGATYAVSATVDLPLRNDLPAGDWYFIVKADANLSVIESDEANNTFTVGPIAITRPPLPELAIENVVVPPDVDGGSTVAITFDVANNGSADVDASWRRRIFLSPDGTLNGATLLADNLVTLAIAQGASVPVALDVPIPPPTTDTVHLVICTDADDDVVEDDELNNCAASGPMTVRRPDLLAQSISGAPTNLTAGDDVTVMWTVRNDGAAAAIPFWTDAIWLSPTGDPSGRLLSTDLRGDTVDSGATYNGVRTVTIPDDVAGDWFLVVEVNAGALLREADVATNVVAAVTPLTIAEPDRANLTPTSLLAPGPSLGGQSITVAWTVENTSATDANGLWVDRVFASSDPALGPTDVELGDFVTGPLAAGAATTHNETIATSLAPGDYYLIVAVDASNQVDEGDTGGELDNVRVAGPFTISSVVVTAQADVDEAPTGTPVTITGQALVEGTTNPASMVPVRVQVSLRGAPTTLNAVTDAAGAYGLTYEPLPNAGGVYSVRAYSAVGAPSAVQDEFVLWGASVAPASGVHVLVPGATQNGSFNITNLTDLPLTGLDLVLTIDEASFTVTPLLTGGSVLAPLESTMATYSVDALSVTGGGVAGTIEVVSDQGTLATFLLGVAVEESVPMLVASPSPLVRNMVVGETKLVEVEIRNEGLAPTGPLDVQLATAEWLSLVSSSSIPALGPGERSTVVIRLGPDPDLPLGPYVAANGLVVTDTTDSGVFVATNLTFNAVSESRGDIRVWCTNEFSYWGVPPTYPENALVELRNGDGQIVASGIADEDGYVVFTDLLEGLYTVRAEADDHASFTAAIFNEGGEETNIEAFMQRTVVTYTWTVVPIDFEDEYTIVIEAVFETNVPAPVITFEPSVLDFTSLESGSQFVELIVENHGLVQADDFRVQFEDHPRFEIIPLVDDIGDIPGMSTRVVPLLMIDNGFGLGVADQPLGTCDPISGEGFWELLCGTPRTYSAPIPVDRPSGGCGGPGGSGTDSTIDWPPGCCGGGGSGGGGGDGGGGVQGPPPAPTYSCPCDICLGKCGLKLAELGFDVVAGPTVGAIKDGIECGLSSNPVKCLLDKVTDTLLPFPGWYTKACNAIKACDSSCCDSSNCDWSQDSLCNWPCSMSSVFDLITSPGVDPFDPNTGDPETDYMITQGGRVRDMLVPMVLVLGDGTWLDVSEYDADIIEVWFGQFSLAADATSEDGELISASEQSYLESLPLPAPVTIEMATTLIERHNRTIDYYAQGIMTLADVPPGWSEDFVAQDLVEPAVIDAITVAETLEDEGYTDALGALAYSMAVLYDSTLPGQGICATVTIQLEQTVAITRQAFEATLTLSNGDDDEFLEGVLVTVDITDAEGMPTDDRFLVFDPDVTGISDVTGTGSLGPGGDATAQWVILPGDEAAPEEPTLYFVSGSLQYAIDGNTIVVPLFPVPITVLPNASIEMRYYLERIVYGDDPFTPETEPSVPFSLGLLVKNNGAGVAGNFHITSGEPQITENEQGLLIDFDLLGTQVNDQEVAPTFNVSFGDVEPDEVNVARWLMISSLQGEFVEFSATVESTNGLDDPDFALIDSVDTFFLHHVVRADEPQDDGRFDFLTDETPDVDDLPDTLHQSTGAIDDVLPITSAQVNDLGGNVAEVAITVPEGWFYVRIDDPFDGSVPLLTALRDDGKELQLDWNAWQTDRIDRSTPAPVVERYIHLLDRGGGGTYTLQFALDGDAPELNSWFVTDTVAGLGTDVSLPLAPDDPPDSDPVSEPRDRPLGAVSVQFTESVDPATFGPTAVTVDGFDLAGRPIDLAGLAIGTSLRLADTVADITFTPPLTTEGRYCIKLVGVADASGNVVSGDARLNLTLLRGDATGDSRTNNTDVGAIASLLGVDPIDPTDVFHVRSDLDLSGGIDAGDLAIVLGRRGRDARFLLDPCVTQRVAGEPGLGGRADWAPIHAVGASDHDDLSIADIADAIRDARAAQGHGRDRTQRGPRLGALTLKRRAGDTAVLPIDWGRIALRVPDSSLTNARELLESFAVRPNTIEAWPVDGWHLGTLPKGLRDEAGWKSLASALRRLGGIASPVLLGKDGAPVLLPSRVLVRFDEGVPADWQRQVLETIAPDDAVTWTARHLDDRLHVIELASDDPWLAVRIANKLAKRGDVVSAEPDLLFGVTSEALTAGDTLAIVDGDVRSTVVLLRAGDAHDAVSSAETDVLGASAAAQIRVESLTLGVALDATRSVLGVLDVLEALTDAASRSDVIGLDARSAYHPVLVDDLLVSSETLFLTRDRTLVRSGHGTLQTILSRAVGDALPSEGRVNESIVRVPAWPVNPASRGVMSVEAQSVLYATLAAGEALRLDQTLDAPTLRVVLCDGTRTPCPLDVESLRHDLDPYDLDGDGAITTGDLLEWMSEAATGLGDSAGDVNGDGVTDDVDALDLLEALGAGGDS